MDAAQMRGNRRKRILVIDDDIATLMLMKAYLEDDYEVGVVKSGKLALDYIREYPTDMLLIDVAMPVMNGFDTLRAIRNLEEGINIPVIFITGSSDRSVVLESICSGADAYLVKPIKKNDLLEKIKDIFERQNNMTHKRTVLAIDDDVTYLKIINTYLKDSFNVVMINSAKLAMEYLRGHKPDVILLDYQMPLYSGSTVLSYIRKTKETEGVPVIMLTGISDKSVVMECLTEHPDKFLLKPVNKIELLRGIYNVLESREQEERK